MEFSKKEGGRGNLGSLCDRCLNLEYQLFANRNTVLYSDKEIAEKINGLIDLMYGKDFEITYQADMFRYILQEIFNDANFRHKTI